MTAEPQHEAPSAVGRGLILIFAAAILAVGIALFWQHIDAVINAVGFYVSIPTAIVVMVVVGLAAAALWFQGHRAYARVKGYAAMTGLVLGLFPFVGLLVLLIAPARRSPPQPSESAPESDAQGG